jgi:hypothetical protein
MPILCNLVLLTKTKLLGYTCISACFLFASWVWGAWVIWLFYFQILFSNLILLTGCEAYNLGTGRGTSVLEIVKAFEKASGKVCQIKQYRIYVIISILQCSLLRITVLISV